MRYAIYDASGTILRTLDIPEELIEQQLADGEFSLQCDALPSDRIDVETGEVIRVEAVPLSKLSKLPPYVQLREKLYPTAEQQLDMIFRDINEGVFGEQAKNSAWFQRIELVKALAPKTGEIDPALLPMIGQTAETIPTEMMPDADEVLYLKRKAKRRK